MNKAEEFRLKTQQHIDELGIAAEEFCNEMLLNFEKNEVAAGLYQGYFTRNDVPDNLCPRIETLVVPFFEEKGFYVYGVDSTSLFGGKFRTYYVNWRGEKE